MAIRVGIQVQGSKPPYQGKSGTTIALRGVGHSRRFLVRWSDLTETEVHARSLRIQGTPPQLLAQQRFVQAPVGVANSGDNEDESSESDSNSSSSSDSDVGDPGGETADGSGYLQIFLS
jgi:hypothetical protein